MYEYHTSERPPEIEMLRSEARGQTFVSAKAPKRIYADDPDAARYLFTVGDGNRWMELGEREPEPKMLFGEFWQQGELCVLFADTNAGKSVLAVQIGNAISRGRQIGPFANNAKPANVLYVDFELSARQFQLRYSNPKGNYNFSANFFRAQFNADELMPGNFETYDEFVIAGLEQKIELVKATVLIIDNITCLRSGTESGAVAQRLMKSLRTLKTAHNLSVLVLSHTPKRNAARPISRDDLQGSKMLINFADSAFAIGCSYSRPGLRYLKQIKQRNTAEQYGEQNVCLCSIAKPRNFLQFEFTGNGHECEHLYHRTHVERERLAQKIAELTKQGLSQRNISKELSISLTTVNRLHTSRQTAPTAE
ncbi:MAG: AAA family ATPase [Sphingobacteriales bacterium]